MKRRKWDAHTTAISVIEGLKGKPVAARCHAQQISESLSEPWRDPDRNICFALPWEG